MKTYKAIPCKDKGIISKKVQIADVFIEAINFTRMNLNEKGFKEFLKVKMACSYDSAMFYVETGRNYLFMEVYPIFEIVDTSSGDKQVMGYTIEPLIELLTLVKKWRKRNKQNNRNMKEAVKEKINPVDFEESNRTLMGGGDADDLRVFSDGRQSVSCWKLTFMGALKLLFTRRIWLGVLSGNSQPPVWMSTDFPFKK